MLRLSVSLLICALLLGRNSQKNYFNYRKPILDEMAWKRETDAVYCASPIDLKRFLESRKMTIVNYQNDGPSFLHKLVGRLLPDFASTVYLVAKKKLRDNSMNKRRILYISFLGILEPVAFSQVFSYLIKLAEDKSLKFTLLTLEKIHFFKKDYLRYEEIREKLSRGWHRLVYAKTS